MFFSYKLKCYAYVIVSANNINKLSCLVCSDVFFVDIGFRMHIRFKNFLFFTCYVRIKNSNSLKIICLHVIHICFVFNTGRRPIYYLYNNPFVLFLMFFYNKFKISWLYQSLIVISIVWECINLLNAHM